MATFHDPFVKQPNAYYQTSGLWIGQRHIPQKKRVYGQPILLGSGEKKEEAYGFAGDLHCLNCGGMFDFIMIEFKEAFPFSILLNGELKEEFEEEIFKCPKCGHRDMEVEVL